jgi:hypothetical protein
MSNFLDGLSTIARKEAIKQLQDRRFTFYEDFDGGSFDGFVQVVDPEDHLYVKIEKFDLGADILTTKLVVSSRFLISGRQVYAGATFDLMALTDVQLMADAKAKLLMKNGDFYVDPTVNDLDIVLAIIDLQPANLSDGKTLLANLANTAFQKRKSKILEQINESLEPSKLTI